MLLICVDSNESNPDSTVQKLIWAGMTYQCLNYHPGIALLPCCVCVWGGGVQRNCMDVHACLTLVVALPCNKYGCSSHHSAHLLILLKYTSITSLSWHASTGQIIHCSGWSMLKSFHAGYFAMLLSSFVDFLFRINHVFFIKKAFKNTTMCQPFSLGLIWVQTVIKTVSRRYATASNETCWARYISMNWYKQNYFNSYGQ